MAKIFAYDRYPHLESSLWGFSERGMPPTTDPFADPEHDLNNSLRYIPSNTLAAIGVSFYFVVSCDMVWLLNKGRWSARYMLCVIIGGFSEFS